MDADKKRQLIAEAVLKKIASVQVLGVGTGRMLNVFISHLSQAFRSGHLDLRYAIASSLETEKRLQAAGIPVQPFNQSDPVELYIDGADEVDALGYVLKGGGGALLREKILAHAAQEFWVLVEDKKMVKALGAFPLACEVLPWARSFVARSIFKLGARAVYRENFITDQGHCILDVHDWPLAPYHEKSQILQNIPGLLEHGLFVQEKPKQVFVSDGVTVDCRSFAL
jgi:ribose 5-phosphate isomerase A